METQGSTVAHNLQYPYITDCLLSKLICHLQAYISNSVCGFKGSTQNSISHI